jgi:hypothetical protein
MRSDHPDAARFRAAFRASPACGVGAAGGCDICETACLHEALAGDGEPVTRRKAGA